MTTLHRVSYIDRRSFLTHEWFPTLFTANDRANELVTLGMEGVDFEEVEVPWDHIADLIHFLNNTPNSPHVKDGTMDSNLNNDDTAPADSSWPPAWVKEFHRANVIRAASLPGVMTAPYGVDCGLKFNDGHKGAIPGAKISDGTISSARSFLHERDPNGVDAHSPGAKLDAGKNRVWLCVSGFSRALNAVSLVTTAGAAKYTPNGWMDVPDGEARYMDAFGRHMMALGRGEMIDPDTNCMHKAQMIWNLLASLELELRNTKE